MSAEWKAIQQNLMLPHDPSKRRFMTLALISPPAPRRKGSKNIKISNLPSAGGDETFQTSSSAKSTTMSASPSLLPTDLHSFMSGSTAGVSATNTTNDGNNSKRKIIAGFVFGEWNVAEATMRLMQRGNRAMGGDPHSMVFDMTRCLLKRMFMMEHLERSSSNSSSSFSASATAAMMAYKSSNSSSNIPAVYRITASSPRRYMTMSTLAYQKKRMQHQEEEGGGGGVVGDVYQTLLLKQQQELVEDKEFTESDFVYARLGFVPVNDGNSSVGGIHVQEFSVLRHDLVTSTWGLSIFK